MAIENIVVNFHGGTPIGGNVNDFNGGSGTLSADLSGYDTGAATGVSVATARTITGNSAGRAASSPTTTLSTDINRQGSFSNDAVTDPSNNTFTYTFPAGVTSADVEVFLCTTFTDQDDLNVTINGVTQAGFDSTNNTTGTFLTFSGVVPNLSDEIVILVENIDGGGGNNFIFHNGHRLFNIVDSSGTTIDVPTGAVALVGQIPTVIAGADASIDVPAGFMALVGQIPTVLAGSDISISIPAGSITIVGQQPNVITGGFVNDNFDGTGALGPQWSVYNGSVIDSGVSRVSDYLEGTVSDNTGERTRWFNTDQGRFDYQVISVPASGFDEYVLAGVGVGPVGDRLGNLPSTGDPFNFCGLMVHDAVMSNIDYMFAVAGHRGTVHATVETKATISGVSDVTDEGANEFGAGVTHCDLGVEIYSTGVALFKMREIGGTWRYTNGGTGLVPSAYNLGPSGTIVNIGIVGYASGTTGIPFVFTADSMTLTDNNVTVDVPTGGITISGQTPVVITTTNETITIPAGQLALAGFAPFVDLGDQAVNIPTGSLNFTGFPPRVLTVLSADVNFSVVGTIDGSEVLVKGKINSSSVNVSGPIK